jgi:hypothetical protein
VGFVLIFCREHGIKIADTRMVFQLNLLVLDSFASFIFSDVKMAKVLDGCRFVPKDTSLFVVEDWCRFGGVVHIEVAEDML